MELNVCFSVRFLRLDVYESLYFLLFLNLYSQILNYFGGLHIIIYLILWLFLYPTGEFLSRMEEYLKVDSIDVF